MDLSVHLGEYINKYRPCFLEMHIVLQIALLKTFRCAVHVGVRLIVYNFTRFRCVENRTPQDFFRCVMVCYRTHMPQKTGPEISFSFGKYHIINPLSVHRVQHHISNHYGTKALVCLPNPGGEELVLLVGYHPHKQGKCIYRVHFNC